MIVVKTAPPDVYLVLPLVPVKEKGRAILDGDDRCAICFGVSSIAVDAYNLTSDTISG